MTIWNFFRFPGPNEDQRRVSISAYSSVSNSNGKTFEDALPLKYISNFCVSEVSFRRK